MFTKTFVKTKLLLNEFKNDERGVTAIEYAVIAVAIAAIVVAVFGSGSPLQTALSDAISAVSDKIGEAGGSTGG